MGIECGAYINSCKCGVRDRNCKSMTEGKHLLVGASRRGGGNDVTGRSSRSEGLLNICFTGLFSDLTC